MKKNKTPVKLEAHMVCDEGGSHNFKTKNEPSGCDKCMCVCCFPCYALCSCFLSDGAALANPFFEQVCCSKSDRAPEDEGRATCTKCGLNEREALDLSDAREAETSRGARNTGYFSNAMSMPSAGISNQPGQQLAHSPVTPNTNMSPDSPTSNTH